MRRFRSMALSCAMTLVATTATYKASAFCGFYVAPEDGPLYNDATMVALMRDGTRTVMSMSNNYKGPAKDFAMVIPVPVVLKKEMVKTLPHDLFKKLEALSAPRLVEYWEQDPCARNVGLDDLAPTMKSAPAEAAPPPPAASAPYRVKIEAQFTVGEYEVVVLSAEESDGLERWLRDNKYNIPKGAADALAPYIKEGMKFFVAKIDIKKVKMNDKGIATLSPIRFHYEEQNFRLPVRLGLLNAQAKQDLLIFLLGKGKRFEAANYTNAFVPTNLEVKDETRRAFGPFYATLFDAAMIKAGGKAIITEYAWETSSCDPCPSPPLQPDDVATLGGDVLFGQQVATDGQSYSPPKNSNNPGKFLASMPPPMMGGGFFGPSADGFVLTRLHTRYDKSTLTDDIVFKSAEAVVGGREHVVGSNGELEKGARKESTNNFQARYAIRHAWTGPIACENPRRGIWGGPPSGQSGSTSPTPATDLASAPRGGIKLIAHVEKGLDNVESWDEAAQKAASSEPMANVAEGSKISGVPPRRACGCSLPGASTSWGLGGLLALTTLSALAMRRRRASS